MKNKIAFFGIICMAFSCQGQDTEQPDSLPVQTVSIEPVTKDYELVFALDATGSMSGLISTAKEKIWDIVSGVSQSQEVKSLKLGMVFYRDRGDQFVTKVYPMTENIDSIYSELLAIGAAGGGDA
ncbi:MAG: hypothetical protein KJP21_01205, partial [Bacteroidia bacterium]|nr:hypothetical protein [Bacteroidia bacterium]